MTDGLTDEQQQKMRRAVPAVMTSSPFIASMGAVFDRYDPDDVVMRIPFRDELTNDGVVYHGGVIASALDTAGAACAWSNHDFDRGSRASTVSMTVQYVGSARNSDLVCTARTVRRAKELIFTEILATDDEGRVVAHAVQTYRIVK
ncbi:MAG TPA: PaaI family thioesterase [Microthrixaceae bacterium]|nr:PaaI family thioesterase [Microthrixaceae bacterium]